jgi:hypothetical protein
VAHRNRAHDGVGGRSMGNAGEGVGPRVTGIDEGIGEHRRARVKPLAMSVGLDRGRRRSALVAAWGEEEDDA